MPTARINHFGGLFDTRSQPDDTELTGFRLVMNAMMRGRRRRCRRGGWQRFLLGENETYNNEDLHDQLIGLQFFFDEFTIPVFIPGSQTGTQYPYFFPDETVLPYSVSQNQGFKCGLYYPDFPAYSIGSLSCDTYTALMPHIGYPYVSEQAPYDPVTGYEPCNTGYPDYLLLSYFTQHYTWCYPGYTIPGYGFGTPIPVYSLSQAYDYIYCGDEQKVRSGCNEAITMLNSFSSFEGTSQLVAATKSRIYALNESTGNWKIIADGLGSGTDEERDCDGCSRIRFMSATHENAMYFANGVDPVLCWRFFDQPDGCELRAAAEIDELTSLNVTTAGVIQEWKGFLFIADVFQDSARHRGRVIWSGFNEPDRWIPADDTLAGFQDLGIGETVLRMEPIGEHMLIYTNRAIYRVVLAATGTIDDPVFFFEQIYEGHDALHYKWSLVNTGDAHYYWTESRVLRMTAHDRRPVELDWMRHCSDVVFEGLSRDDLVLQPINEQACDLFTGGWNAETKEVWFSWPTGDSTCPTVSLVYNVTPGEEAADIVDHGFTAFYFYHRARRLTILEWAEQNEFCPREDLLSLSVKEGAPVQTTSDPFVDPPTSILNAAEDPDQANDPDSLCARLADVFVEDFCSDCDVDDRFIMASASDKTLKEYSDDIFFRERLTNGSVYVADPYTTVLESGTDDLGTDQEKVAQRFKVDLVAAVQPTPNTLELFMGYSQQPDCVTWKKIRIVDPADCSNFLEGRELGCISNKSASEHAADNTRPSTDVVFPMRVQGKFLAWRLRIEGTGGQVCFSGATLEAGSRERRR